MNKNTRLALPLLALLASTASAWAVPGVIVGGTSVFAGPTPAYPQVGSFAPGTQVEVFGCQPGWGWCDVASGPYRGWAPGSQIQIFYNGQPGAIPYFGPMMGLPILGFSFGDYWGAHYRGNSWFSQQDRWGGGGGGGQWGGRPGPMGGGAGQWGGGNRPGGGGQWNGGGYPGGMGGGARPGGMGGPMNGPGGGGQNHGGPPPQGGGDHGGHPGGGNRPNGPHDH